MKPKNLIAASQGNAIINEYNLDVDQKFKYLKTHEIRNLTNLCNILKLSGCTISDFDGFFISYSIAQLGKEFDLLRFGKNYILNIELKSELKIAQKEKKILKQMHENYYYLKFLNTPIELFTFVENDGFYRYNIESSTIDKIKPETLAECICEQDVDYSVDPDNKFVPSNYLISPLNSTAAFINNEYFFTSAQPRIKTEILSELTENPLMFFCISANAGTGKTLLTYDIANELMSTNKNILLIHCGILNRGHIKLIYRYKWNIVSIKDISNNKENINLDNIDFIFVDESQRIRFSQLEALTKKAVEKQIPMLFSYDTKQYLKTGETLDLSNYLNNTYPHLITSTKKLTNKIRTNKAISSFITNLLEIGKSHDNLHYDCITIDYFNNIQDLTEYIDFLEQNGWKPITYTSSSRTIDSYNQLSKLCNTNAHAVIGQEFSKVVFVMDNNFQYNERNRLTARSSYYDAKGMLYQIVTRVINELKIIILNNPKLYEKLLEIKAMGN